MQQVTLRLTKELPKPFTENDKTHEPTVLFHDNPSARNILIDENGVVTAVLDWELASVFHYTKHVSSPGSSMAPNKCKFPPRRDFDVTKTER